MFMNAFMTGVAKLLYGMGFSLFTIFKMFGVIGFRVIYSVSEGIMTVFKK